MKKDDFLNFIEKVPEDTEFNLLITSIDSCPALIDFTVRFSFYHSNLRELLKNPKI